MQQPILSNRMQRLNNVITPERAAIVVSKRELLTRFAISLVSRDAKQTNPGQLSKFKFKFI